MEPVIQVENLVHRFGARAALDGLSFEVRRGEVFGLIGPNGAGKTTSVRLLNGLYRPTSGKMRVLGLDPASQGRKVRLRSGVLTENPALYERLSARENLEFFGALAGMKPADCKARVSELLAFFELDSRASERVGVFSKGMKQRLALARALLTRPELLFLDEPTSSLDPEATQQVRELIQSIRKRGEHTVVLCTHHLDEAERLCDRVAVMKAGRVLAAGSLAELSARYRPEQWLEVELLEPMTTPFSGRGVAGVLAVEFGYPLIRVKIASRAAIPATVARLSELGAPILRVQLLKPSLEQIYFQLQQAAE